MNQYLINAGRLELRLMAREGTQDSTALQIEEKYIR